MDFKRTSLYAFWNKTAKPFVLLHCKSEHVQCYTNCINCIHLLINLTLQQFSEVASKQVNSYFSIKTIIVFINVLNRFLFLYLFLI